MEDEPSIRLMTTRILRREGYTVLEAANGDEALQVATAHARTKRPCNDRGGRRPGVQFIQQPFTPASLVLKVLNQEE